MLKNVLLAGVAAGSLIAGQAIAADMPVKAPPATVVAQAWNWSGFYIGGTFGGVWGDDQITNLSIVPNFVGTRDRIRGALAGGTVGVNWQIGQFVLGAEADWSWSSAELTYSNFVCSPLCTERWKWFGTARARGGVAYNQFLFYVTGGAVFTHFDTRIGTLDNGSGNANGWTVGGGLEFALSQNWSAKVEYLYVDVGNPTYFNRTPDQIRLDPHINIIRGGINYRFGAGPVIARF
jgi:outer membrane immunogenic protein